MDFVPLLSILENQTSPILLFLCDLKILPKTTMFKSVLIHFIAFIALSTQVLGQCGPSFIPLNLGNDTTLCQGQSLTIGATSTYDTYLWNTGNMNPTITVSNPGTYTLNVSTLGQNLVVNGDYTCSLCLIPLHLCFWLYNAINYVSLLLKTIRNIFSVTI